MSDRDTPLLVGLTLATGLLAYKLYRDRQGNELSLPPSPKSYPVIGNLPSIPTSFEHLGFMQLGNQLGSKIFSLSAFGTTVVVMNDKDDAINLFEKRSTTYSDRSCPPMVGEPSLLDWGNFGSALGYGDRWRRYRRLMNPWLNKQAAVAYHESQEKATRQLLKRLLDAPKDTMSSHKLEAELYFAISSILLGSLYGYEAESPKDTILVRAKSLIAYLSYAMLPSNCMVNNIPALRYVPEWFPGAGWKREASKWRREKEAVIDDMYNIGLENMKKGQNAHLMAALMRGQALNLGLTEEEADDHVKHISITMLTGGADTTVGQLVIFFLAMLLYPEVQKKAQAELDTVIGKSRLPTIEDRAQLGYVDRILKETLRWGPIGPIAAPHTCFKDDEYKGYRIPKGAVVFGNVWAMTRDETVYKNPEEFDPDRFLDPSAPIPPVFGWGRRRCPGMHFGEASLFIVIASVLMTFNIGVGQDENGEDAPPSGKFINAMLLTPQPFVLKLTPRSTSHAELVRSSC